MSVIIQCPRGSLPTSPTFYFKLPYMGHFSVVTRKKIRQFIKRYCNDLDIKLVFPSFKIGNMFGVKDPWQALFACGLKFACAGCNQPAMSANQPGIFPHVCVCIFAVIKPLMFSNILRILNIVAPCLQ